MPSNATPTESIVTVSGAELSEAATGILEQFPDGLDGDLPSAEEVASRLDQMTNQYRVPLDEARRAAVSHYRDVLGLEYDDLEFPGQTAADVALSSVNQDEQ